MLRTRSCVKRSRLNDLIEHLEAKWTSRRFSTAVRRRPSTCGEVLQRALQGVEYLGQVRRCDGDFTSHGQEY
eukprot:4198549-Pyramimonas_sp.AAC.1